MEMIGIGWGCGFRVGECYELDESITIVDPQKKGHDVGVMGLRNI